MITCYRTSEFDKYCKAYPRRAQISLVDTLVSWEMVYGPQIAQLERRVYKQRTGNFSGWSRLALKHVAERLDVAESAWNDGSNEWYSDMEEMTFRLETEVRATSARSLSRLFNDSASTEPGWNKSVFVTLVPRGDDFLSVCPIIPVFEGDFLGIFAGTIRFAEDVDVNRRIPGPSRDLSLDYSHVTGTLNQMQVSKPNGCANVRLEWQPVNEQDESGPCESWRVLVLATRPIIPFEPLVRAAPHMDQFLLHQEPEHARRGFTEKQQ